MNPIALLKDLIRAKSPSLAEGPAREVLLRALGALGLEPRVDEAGNIYAERGGEGELVVLTGHMDVVPEGELERWPVPPYAGEERGGFVYGRGAVDMKGALAAMVAAAERLLAEGYPGRFGLLFVVGEEIGGVGSRFAAGRVRARTFILGEPSSLRLMRGHRGRIEPHLVFEGEQAHAAIAKENPLFALGRALVRLEGLELGQDPDTGKNTCQPTKLELSPNAINVVPGRVELALDCRYGPSFTGGEIEASVAAASGGAVYVPKMEVRAGRVRLGYRFDFPPYVARGDDPRLARALSALGQEEAGLWPFTTDAPYLAAQGALVLGYGPGDPRLAHTTEERVAAEEVWAAARGYARLVRALGGLDG